MATQSFLQILKLLDRYGVEYVIVGGVAAVLHGAPVTTFDIDALVKVDVANADCDIESTELFGRRETICWPDAHY